MAAPEGMDYLTRLPRRIVVLYLPLAVLLFVLLFPFYWMTTTTFKPDGELYDYTHYNPFWVVHPTLQHINKLLFETSYPSWLINTIIVSVAATAISLIASVCAAYAIERLRVVDASVFPTVTSANTNAPTLMVARRAADLILEG